MGKGWDPRPSSVEAVLAASTPIAEARAVLADLRYDLRLRAYTNAVDLPVAFLSSVRVIVFVDDRVVVCRNSDGIYHPWPGGRIEAGESHAETACREVHEETGWLLDPDSLRYVGWLHIEHLRDRPADHAFGTYADFFNVVYTGRATERDGGHDADWTDTQGYELSSELLTLDEAIARLDGNDAPVTRAFLDLTGQNPNRPTM